jgi:hypothetical protein
MSHFLNKGQSYLNPEPRLSAAYKLRDDLALKASFATMNQYIHLLSNTGIGLPTDLWVPSTNQVRPHGLIRWRWALPKILPGATWR